jgi:hypothetical protein
MGRLLVLPKILDPPETTLPVTNALAYLAELSATKKKSLMDRETRTATQGRFGGGQGQEYAENFILEYWRPSAGKWMTYKNHSGHSVSYIFSLF